MVKCLSSPKSRAIAGFLGLVAFLLLANYAAHFFFFRIDLTGDRRYTLAESSKQVMRQLDENLHIYVFLDGDMPVEMKKLRTTIQETLDELKVHAPTRLRYEFVNITEDTDPRELDAVYASLQNSGLSPVIIQENARDGSRSERILFPGAIITCTHELLSSDENRPTGTREMAVNFLQSNAAVDTDESLLTAQQNVEPALVSAFARIAKKELPHVAFVEGHGEADEYETGDISKEMASFARLSRVTIDGNVAALMAYDLVIIASPVEAWSEADKLALDQYIMQGGRTAWFIDAVDVHHDSLANGENTFALARGHGLDDQLFKYGVRINPNVVSDLQCAYLPVNIAPSGQTADFKPMPWTYYPLLMPPPEHAITRGLNLIASKYPSSIDTVGKNPAVERSILLHSSQYSRSQTIPFHISLSQATQRPDAAAYSKPAFPIALLSEGSFPSAFLNRPLSSYRLPEGFLFKGQSEPTKMIVVADGDIIRNDIIQRATGTRIFPLGFDRYMNVQFGNRNFVKNCIYYLLDDDNTMQIRPREWTLRTLDRARIYPERSRWISINTLLPLALTLLAGTVFIVLRNKKYGGKNRPQQGSTNNSISQN
jgi:ABC-2 type transport system permease protein